MSTDQSMFVAAGKTGILLLHDLGGDTAELRTVADSLARAGYSVSLPHLGAGIGREASSNSASAWLMVAERALCRLESSCDHVIVGGQHTGAALTLALARQHPERILALALYSPALWPGYWPSVMPARLVRAIPQSWAARFAALADGLNVRPSGIVLDAAAASAAANNGGANQSAGLHSLQATQVGRLVDSVRASLGAVRHPVLLVHRRADEARNAGAATFLQRRLGGRVESTMIEEAQSPAGHEQAQAWIGRRTGAFATTVLAEFNEARGNLQRRQRMAGGKTAAA